MGRVAHLYLCALIKKPPGCCDKKAGIGTGELGIVRSQEIGLE